ncbi:hypothetical protein [Cytophaga hutchinsonii]|uniref:Glycosyltransferase RgtA/B/C/D-like domain-containing protein n=1 Tax=Cytophaga hutchinsonii (strain ATCC 33406 / DSM 1761 / CIP 103989 / NBRC 15051 / NCIMB 9469 / D465) TaxID=269798 RepID=A0A6N4SRU2_CYTH3|nr:hypothetical protein [Cytophaga hutchinsonii]ABG59005.1 conserved hypothetical protein [Cytophaga hutchinsonii ATCC 33406]SFX39101.1 hypothetical protein SAMN04487930_103304 [Cytophaga hutchinsonii ATCC 33406]
MHTFINLIKLFLVELLIIFSVVIIINKFVGNTKTTIKADAEGYYDYLPSIFIHHDLVRLSAPKDQNPQLYNRINNRPYNDYEKFKVNKYPCGTAILQLPFFTYTLLFNADLENNDMDGYQYVFHRSIFFAALTYLFLSLIFLKKILETYSIKTYIIILTQVLVAQATLLINYVNYDAGFSHVYSLFAITAFCYFTIQYFKTHQIKYVLITCVFLGLILLLRQINLLIILAIPFLAGSAENLRTGTMLLFSQYKKLLIGLLLVIGVFSIQCILWYLQTGHFFVYSYQGEGFDFTNPKFIDILFSYKKGLFVYTPVLFICLSGLGLFLFKRNYYLFFTWLTFFVILTYILSSWHSWYYGASYGLRAYIDFYPLFFILLACFLNEASMLSKSICVVLCLITIPVNIIQTYQYKENILHWYEMDKNKYWKVFLETDDAFRGILWQKEYDYDNYALVKEIALGDIYTTKNTTNLVLKINSAEIPDFNNVRIVQALAYDDFKTDNRSKLVLWIQDSTNNKNLYWNDANLLHFPERKFNDWQTGIYNYEFIIPNDETIKTIGFEVKTAEQGCDLKNMRLRFLKLR